MFRFVGITGTPGTGKKTIAPLVASRLGITCYGLNDLALSEREARWRVVEYEVDTSALKKKVGRLTDRQSLLYGHLLPFIAERGEMKTVIVLRCEPSTLKMRLLGRGYAAEKVIENVEAELIGLVSSQAVKAFGRTKVLEFDTSITDPKEAAAIITDMARGPRHPMPPIDWTLTYDSASKLRSLLAVPRAGSGRT